MFDILVFFSVLFCIRFGYFIEKGKKQIPHKKRIVESLILLRNTTYDNMSFEKKRSTDRKLDDLIEELFAEEDIESRLLEKANSIRIEIDLKNCRSNMRLR